MMMCGPFKENLHRICFTPSQESTRLVEKIIVLGKEHRLWTIKLTNLFTLWSTLVVFELMGEVL